MMMLYGGDRRWAMGLVLTTPAETGKVCGLAPVARPSVSGLPVDEDREAGEDPRDRLVLRRQRARGS
jgi:hypothetical protein